MPTDIENLEKIVDKSIELTNKAVIDDMIRRGCNKEQIAMARKILASKVTIDREAGTITSNALDKPIPITKAALAKLDEYEAELREKFAKGSN